MADQTTLPTCTVGSLGGPKIDRRAAIDPRKDDSAAEIMLRNACIEELFRRIGLSDGSTPGSFEQRIAALEASGGGLDLMNPRVHFRSDDFDDWSAASTPGWDNGGGADPWIILGGIRGGIGAPFAQQCLANTPPIYLVDHELDVRFVCHVDVWDPAVGSQFVFALRDAFDDAVIAGVWVHDYGPEGVPPAVNRCIEGIIGDGEGGEISTYVAPFANDTNYEIRFRLERIAAGVANLYVSANGGTEVSCGTAPTPVAPRCYLSLSGPHVVEATSTFHIHQVRRRANWDPGLDP